MNAKTKQRIIEAKELFELVRYGEPRVCTYSNNDLKANGLQNCINDFNEYNGWLSERVNVMGTPRVNHYVDGMTGERLDKVQSVRFTTGQGMKGSADIHVVIMGISLKVEVKIGKDRQSAAQKNYERMAGISGAKYVISRSFLDYLEVYDTITLEDTMEAKIGRITQIVTMKAEASRVAYRKYFKKHNAPPNARDIYHNAILPVGEW